MESRNFDRERFAVLALISSSGVFCVAGVLSQFLDLAAEVQDALDLLLVLALAGLCGFSLWVANAAAACAQILAEQWRQKPVALAIALATAAITGLVSVLGVDLGYMRLVEQRETFPDKGWIIAAGFALAFVKIAMGFVIEACERLSAAEQRADDAALAAKDGRIRELEKALAAALKNAAQPANNNRAPRRRSLAHRAASAAAGATLALAGGAAANAAETPSAPAPERAAKTQSAGEVTPEARAKARAMIAAGAKPHAASDATGVPPGTCRRYACELRNAA